MAKDKKKAASEQHVICFGTYTQPGDDFCKECDDEEDCIKKTESLNPSESEEDDSEDPKDDDEVFEPDELELDDEDKRVEILSELTDEELQMVSDFYEIDVEDPESRNGLLKAIDEYFEDFGADLKDDPEEDDKEGDDDSEEDMEKGEDDGATETPGEDPEDEVEDPEFYKARIKLLKGTIVGFHCMLTEAFEKVLEDLQEIKVWMSSGQDDIWDPEVDADASDDEEDLTEEIQEDFIEMEPEYFRPFVEKHGCKVSETEDKIAAKKGRTYWATLFYTDKRCLLVLNGGDPKRLPGTTELKAWGNHPSIDAFDENAKKLLVRHFKDKS